MNEFNIFSTTKPLLEYLKERRENQKFVKSIELGATFLLISFFLFFAIKPTITTISALVGENTSKEILSKQMRLKINNIIQAQDNFSKIQEKYQIVEDALPDSPRYSDALTQVRSASQRSLVNLDKINFNISENTEKNNPNLNNFSIIANTKSNFSSVVNLIDKLLNNRRIMDFTNINLNNLKEGNSLGQINFSFSTDFFYWNQNEKK